MFARNKSATLRPLHGIVPDRVPPRDQPLFQGIQLLHLFLAKERLTKDVDVLSLTLWIYRLGDGDEAALEAPSVSDFTK